MFQRLRDRPPTESSARAAIERFRPDSAPAKFGRPFRETLRTRRKPAVDAALFAFDRIVALDRVRGNSESSGSISPRRTKLPSYCEFRPLSQMRGAAMIGRSN